MKSFNAREGAGGGMYISYVNQLIDSWLDEVFGPMYHLTFRLRALAFTDEDLGKLLVSSPFKFYDTVVKVLGSEVFAESFIGTFLAFLSKKFRGVDIPSKEDFINWLRNNDVKRIQEFLTSIVGMVVGGEGGT